jgi:catalase
LGTFTSTREARTISRAAHLTGPKVDVVARFSNFPGGASHPDAAPESNPRGLAVQFRLPDGATTDLLAHSINGFPGRTVDDFGDFLEAISPLGGSPEPYLATHPAAAAFVHAVQTHGVPASYAGLSYYVVNAFFFQDANDDSRAGRYTWQPVVPAQTIEEDAVSSLDEDFLVTELCDRLRAGAVEMKLVLDLAEPQDSTDDANAQWPSDRQRVILGTMRLDRVAADSAVAEQGLFFDPVRLVDGITISDDPLLVGRTRTYPISLARRHQVRPS